jgi:hypothetical protein
VAGHHDRVVPAGHGPGHGDRWRTCCGPAPRPQIRRTAGPGSPPSCGPCPGPRRTRTDQAADDRRLTGTGPRGRTRTVPSLDHTTAMASPDLARGPRSHRWIRPARSPEGWPWPQRGTGITASVAQRRSHGLQPDPERPGAHDQHRASRICRQPVNHPSVRRVVLPARTASGPSTMVRRGSRRRWHPLVVRPMPPASAGGGTSRARSHPLSPGSPVGCGEPAGVNLSGSG